MLRIMTDPANQFQTHFMLEIRQPFRLISYWKRLGTAKLIAFAILTKIYGSQQISREQPFRAILKDGVWTVEGYLPKDMAGGVAIIKLSKSDGRVLYVHHGK